MSNNKLDIKSLESWLWEAACKIRGPVDAPKYKDYILPLDDSVVQPKEADEKLESILKEMGVWKEH